MFKKGDKVKRKEGMWEGIQPTALEPFDSFTVYAYFAHKKYPTVIFQESGSYQWDAAYFELIEEEKVKNKFSVGDRVILANPQAASGHDLEEGWIGYVINPSDGSDDIPVQVAEEKSRIYYYFNEDELEMLSAGQTAVPNQQTTPDIARPVLEERKIGKVRMDLFDEGFPNAVLEIAKVMTWANQNKGYKDHDWKQLPNADTEFSAAASRHKIKSFIQKVEGVEALQRTDEESKIVHLAHTAFNVLAELELVLTGVIK